MSERTRYTATFLIDKENPTNIILLKRASTKSYAPDFCTGIGGALGDLQGHESETIEEGAYRELKEETVGYLTKSKIIVHEFARCIYDTGNVIHYLYALYDDKDLPKIDPKDGELIRVSTAELFNQNFIPSAGAVCKEWSRRDFSIDKPFTIFVKELGVENTVKLIEILRIEEGLQDPKK